MEVLPAAGLPELDCNSNCLPPELEVKKLQQLVRRLELQNEQLRASGCSAGPTPGFGLGSPGAFRLHGPLLALRCHSPPEEPFDYFQPHGAGDGASEPGEDEAEPSVLDELELLDLEVLCCPEEEEEETWLYESPKAVELGVDSLSPLQWSRHVLDRPKTEVEAARRSLSLRLEQVSRWRSSLSSPSHSSPGPPLSRVAGVSPIRAPPCSTPLSSERHVPPPSSLSSPAPSLSSPLHRVLHRTLSPVGKEFSPLAERTPTFLPHLANSILRRSVLSPQSSMDSDLGASEDESLTLHGYKLHDLTDVQVMARLQEESLRQDYASTSSTLANRRSQSFTFQLSQLSAGLDLEEEDEEDDEDYGLLPPPQARLTRLPHSHTFSSMRDWRRSTTSLSTPPSTPSTPPLPSAGFAFQPLVPSQLQGLGAGSFCTPEPLGFRSGSDKLRRSMPNLVRAPSMPSVPIPTNPSASPCLLRNSLSFDSSSGLARLQSSIPSPGLLQHRVQSVGNFLSLSRQPLKATAYVSPTIKGSASTGLQPPSGSGGSNSWGNSGIPLFSKSAAGGGTPTSTPGTPRSSLPRPASFLGATSSTPRSKVALPARSLLTPPKSLSTFSALRDGTWRDGCY
ncbi:SLAIN motif-containing protein 1-like isoform X1 [Platichthys flesus]|uniref:SLAIN motif-containing protein 1-like isoform X1 n=1 Tax=Platichthys flesus TaxID=8260 RepID=UPI002DB98A62|nr:SLAIN motif-containing protein 1-like isoform X1 [Platichthys flesus]